MGIDSGLLDEINEAAQSLGQNGAEFKSADVSAWISEQRPIDWPRFEKSFQINFSHAVTKDEYCLVERVPGKFAYRLVEDVDEAETEQESDADSATNAAEESQQAVSPGNVQREVKLYGTLQEWLTSRGYQAAITSTTKKGGTWGNPDVTGLRMEELPTGPVGFECSTIEAKLSANNWKYYIIEAVAHKRFAHRAWFSFAVGTDTPNLGHIKDADQLAEYAEKYRIGILIVFISRAHYEQLTTGDAATLELGPDDVRIETLWPAMYEPVHVTALSEFMTDVLDIRSHGDFGNFGR